MKMPIIRCETGVQAPAARCFDLARSVDLHVDSSTEIGARAIGGRRGGLSGRGDVTVWSARFFGLRFAMSMRLEDFAFPNRFTDRMTCGLLRRFTHVYRFDPLPDGGCTMSDELLVEAPFGWFGRLVEAFYLSRRMRGLVRRRLEHIKQVAEGDGWRRYLPATDGKDHAPLPPRSGS